jgi:hypothetical protein
LYFLALTKRGVYRADMSKRGNGYGSESRVTILKKSKSVKIGTCTPPSWNLTVNSATRFAYVEKSKFIQKDSIRSNGGRTESANR